MNEREAIWLEHQRRRWMRPDAERFLQPDRDRFDRRQATGGKDAPHNPHALAWTGKRGRWMPDNDGADASQRTAAMPLPDLQALRRRRALEELRAKRLELKSAALLAKLESLLRKYERALKAGFRPDQPRVPAGNPDGGEWTSDGGQSDRIRIAQLGGTLTDAFGDPYYQPGGHHELTKDIYEKWNLPEETRKVFRDATTGKIPLRMRTTPDGVPIGNQWNRAHRIYNEAVEELANRFMEANNIKPEQMTPDQARAILKEIRESQDPRIRDFNNAMRLLRRLFRFRTGRGNE